MNTIKQKLPHNTLLDLHQWVEDGCPEGVTGMPEDVAFILSMASKVEEREQYGLDEAWNDVRHFHITFNKPAPDKPTMQSVEDITNRANWIRSEVEELEEAATLVDQADAYVDILYFAIGGLVELGVKPGAVFEIVQAANMAKLHKDPETGAMIPVIRSSDGKIVKPDGWISPEPMIEQVIRRQVYNDAK